MTADPTPFDLDVRTRVYTHFVDHGVAPSTATLAAELHADEAKIRQSLVRLEASRYVTLTPGTRHVWMAHPFSAVPTQYPVEAGDRRYWANCAWDALAIPQLLGVDSRIRTQCPDCALPIVVAVEDGGLRARADAVVHFLVPPPRFWENIGFT